MSTTTGSDDNDKNPLTEISSATELDFYIRGGTSSSEDGSGGIVIVTFSTHWCGPCQRSKPQLIELAKKYSTTTHPNNNKVSFAYVPETDMNDDFIDEYNINAFPTYICFVAGSDNDEGSKEIERVEGADLKKVESMIQKYLS